LQVPILSSVPILMEHNFIYLKHFRPYSDGTNIAPTSEVLKAVMLVLLLAGNYNDVIFLRKFMTVGHLVHMILGGKSQVT
jgi:hypothetical protein